MQYRGETILHGIGVDHYQDLLFEEPAYREGLFREMGVRLIAYDFDRLPGLRKGRAVWSPAPSIIPNAVLRLLPNLCFEESFEFDMERHYGTSETRLVRSSDPDAVWIRSWCDLVPAETGTRRVYGGDIDVPLRAFKGLLEKVLHSRTLVCSVKGDAFTQRWVDAHRVEPLPAARVGSS